MESAEGVGLENALTKSRVNAYYTTITNLSLRSDTPSHSDL
jgi:hypothetical protein